MLKIQYGDNEIAWGDISHLEVNEGELVAVTADNLSIVIKTFDSYEDALTIKEWIEATEASIPNVGGGGVIIIVIDDF